MNVIGKGMRYVIRILIAKLVKVEIYEILSKLIKENNFKTYVEVGVWKGKTLFNIAKENKNTKIYGIDDYTSKNYERCNCGDIMGKTHIKTYNKIKDNVLKKSLKFKNVFIRIEKSLSAVTRFEDNNLDIVFIDALHDYKSISEDIKAWLPKVRKGGILCGHDFKLNHFSVIKAVGDLIGYDNIEVKGDVSIWIHRKEG